MPKKYYWLKLKRDFFKRHDVQIIEGMENGKDYILFYLKLLVESIDHDGNLRFSETIPYDDNMLATITRTNIDTVRCAMKIFHQFGLIDILDDRTLFMNKITEMIGSETEWAKKKRTYRIAKDETAEGQKKTLSDKSIETELETEKDIDKNIEKKGVGKPRHVFLPPEVEEVKAYCKERKNGVDAQHWHDFYTAKDWMIGKNKMKDWKAAVRTWETKKETTADAVPYEPPPRYNFKED